MESIASKNQQEKPEHTFLGRFAASTLQLGPVRVEPEDCAAIELFLQASPGERRPIGRAERWAATAIWQKRTYKMLVFFSELYTPKAIDQAATIAEALAERDKRNPLFVTRFLAKTHIHELEERGVSALDLCGNGVIVLLKEGVLIWHDGEPNRFKDDAPIKNVYRKNSSIAARMFLVRQFYRSFKELLVSIEDHGGRLTHSTVSKVLKALQNDRLVHEWGPELSNWRGLLDKLSDNYAAPDTADGVCVWVDGDLLAACRTLTRRAAELNVRICLSGRSSAFVYLGTPAPDQIDIFANHIELLLEALPNASTHLEKWNLRLSQIDDDRFFFDKRVVGALGIVVASPVQTILELNQTGSAADKVFVVALAEQVEVQSRQNR